VRVRECERVARVSSESSASERVSVRRVSETSEIESECEQVRVRVSASK
jgi:hypothetical protein